MATDVLVENDFLKKWKKNVCETVVWLLADQVKNLIEKKWPGQSDSGMASGGSLLLQLTLRTPPIYSLIL